MDHSVSQEPAKTRPLSAPNAAVDRFSATDGSGGAAQLLFSRNNRTNAAPVSQTEASKAIVESIYSAPFLKTPVLPGSSTTYDRPSSAMGQQHFGGSGYLAAPAAAATQQNTHKSRPSSSSTRRGAPLSAVERAVNYGKNVPNYLLPKGELRDKQAEGKGGGAAGSLLDSKNAKFVKLFDASVIDRLDEILIQSASNKN